MNVKEKKYHKIKRREEINNKNNELVRQSTKYYILEYSL